MHFSPKGEFVTHKAYENVEDLSAFKFEPLEFKIVSVVTSRSGFAWLEELRK